jgi:hypothetical protein
VRILGADCNSILLAAVADGAGTASEAEVGSSVAVQALAEQVEAWLGRGGSIETLTRDITREWLDGVREQIAECATEAGKQMRDFACTLVYALVSQSTAAVAQIGDGAVVVPEADTWKPVFWPQHGPYANTTYFVTDPDASERLLFDRLETAPAELAIFTDGLEQLLLDFRTKEGHRPFFEHMMPPVRKSTARGQDVHLSQLLFSYLSSPQVASRTNDDLTLVLASRREPLATLVARTHDDDAGTSDP